jgi:hypothetical protein
MPNNDKPVIQRYLNEDHLPNIITHMKPVIKLLNSSYGEFSLQLRQDYFNIYYQGNSAAKVRFNAGGTYSARVHSKFTEDIIESLNMYSDIKHSPASSDSGGYYTFRIQPQNLHGFFQRKHLDRISGNIRKVHNGEEITMEQVIVTDNPPTKDFIIIDRQVADHEDFARIDLLALKRDSDGKYHFIAIELKLGRNPELREQAGAQANSYVEHIRHHIDDYADCYQTNYCQKKKLGLFVGGSADSLPETIYINRDVDCVRGIVISSGYSVLARENMTSLQEAIGNHGWHITAKQMPAMRLEGMVE